MFDDVKSLKEQNQDFAYFCRFTNDNRSLGEEMLVETDDSPIFFNSKGADALNEKIPELLSSVEKGMQKIVPMFVSYHFISEIFRFGLRNTSNWPMIGTLIPSNMRREKISRDTGHTSNENTPSASISRKSREKLETDIAEVIERIRGGELLQTVISHRFEVEEFSAPELLEYMVRNDLSRYVYYYKMGNLEIIGSSPENVFVRDGEKITIHPIAGTRKRIEGFEDQLVSSLRNDSKELCEHRMLVDLARNDLSRVCAPGSVKVSRNMIPEKFYSVIHLTSSVEGVIREDTKSYNLFSSVFPAGTVSGAPKRRALEIIDEYETHGRGPYGGAIGLLGENYAEMALTIRSAFSNGQENYVQAGAGIVKDSVPSNEVDEMIAKANTIMAGGLLCA